MAQKFDAKDRKEGTDYQIASMKNRIIRCTQGLFGSQSLLYSVYVFSQKVPLYIPTSSGRLKVEAGSYARADRRDLNGSSGLFLWYGKHQCTGVLGSAIDAVVGDAHFDARTRVVGAGVGVDLKPGGIAA